MSDHDVPLVSIVTPTYNSASYLPDLLRSVEEQDYPNIEHVVIDDGSSDGGATIRLLDRHPAVRWRSRENRGQYATLNEGFGAATGVFVTAISADDTYADAGAIAALARCLLAHPDSDVAYGFTLHVNEDGRPLPVQPYQRYPPWMLRYNLGFIFHCSMLVRRDVLIRDEVLFDDSLRYIGDAEWMVRLSQRYRFRRVDRHIGAYRHHGGQVTAMATGDEADSSRRREEHDRVHRRYGTSRVLQRLVEVYDTGQQRRVKAVSAWQRGGRREVARLAAAWLGRKSGGR